MLKRFEFEVSLRCLSHIMYFMILHSSRSVTFHKNNAQFRFALPLFFSVLLASFKGPPLVAGSPTHWKADSHKQWKHAAENAQQFTLKEGAVHPNRPNAKFTSVLKSFAGKRKAKDITLRQTGRWQSWESVDNIEPDAGIPRWPDTRSDSSLRPVLLKVRTRSWTQCEYHLNNVPETSLSFPKTTTVFFVWSCRS